MAKSVAFSILNRIDALQTFHDPNIWLHDQHFQYPQPVDALQTLAVAMLKSKRSSFQYPLADRRSSNVGLALSEPCSFFQYPLADRRLSNTKAFAFWLMLIQLSVSCNGSTPFKPLAKHSKDYPITPFSILNRIDALQTKRIYPVIQRS